MSCFAVSKRAGRLKNNKEGSPEATIVNDFSAKNNGKVNKKGNHLPKVEILQEVTFLFSFCQFLFRLFNFLNRQTDSPLELFKTFDSYFRCHNRPFLHQENHP